MRSIRKIKTSAHQRYRRHLRVRKKIAGTPERPRLVVFRSSKHIYAQLVDDERGLTLAGAADTSEGVQIEGKGKVARSFAVGKLIAAKAKEKGIASISDLKKLKPPADEQSVATQWLVQVQGLKNDLQEIRDKANAKDIQAVQQVVPKAEQHNARSNELATELGMTVCNSD